jgi:membrane fusion protein (multidrug efflux system)
MEEDPKTYQPERPGGFFFAGWIVAVVTIVGLTAGLVLAHGIRLNRQIGDLEQQLAQGPRVLVQPVVHSPRSRSIQVPGTLHGYIETTIYAKIAGYLKSIRVDKGDRVRQGQLIAILDAPELDHQVTNARASYQFAMLTDKRNRSLLEAGVIAAQAADASHAQMLESEATLNQLASMQRYKIILAPFDGIITARYVDPGALIPQQITPAATPAPIVALATLSPLRIYADVPQSTAPFIRDGDPATITLTEFPDHTFNGIVNRHSNALSSATRSMQVEVDLPNADHSLLPGMYATIDFAVNTPAGVPMVPDDALVFRGGKTYVPVVRNSHLKLAEVTLGYDNGINVQVTQGVSDQDMVALNVGQSARDGEPVRPITADQAQ